MGLLDIFKKKQQTETPYEYQTHMIFGNQLKETLESVKDFDTRDCFSELQNFLFSNMTDRVCLIYGLRRTGKTIMMRQAMLAMTDEERAKCAYIKITINDSMKGLNEDFKHLRSDGFKYVFIDEITLLDDFVDNAAILSDIYAAEGMKIVLSGTDSLAFWYTVRGELYDRAVQIHTTYISYPEHKRLLKKDGYDEYLKIGGVLSPNPLFSDIDATDNYIETSILRNIQRSIKAPESMLDEISQVVNGIAYNYVLVALNDENASYDLHLSARYLKNQQESKYTLPIEKVNKIRDYLKAIDAIVRAESTRIIFNQPGIMYSKIENILDELMEERHYSSMTDVDREVFRSNLHDLIMIMLRDDYSSLDEASETNKSESEEINSVQSDNTDTQIADIDDDKEMSPLISPENDNNIDDNALNENETVSEDTDTNNENESIDS